MRRNLLLLLVLSMLPALLLVGLPATGEPPASSGLSIDQLIERLGDNDYHVREAASRELKKRPEALGAVRRALTSTDPEVRRRCEEIIPLIRFHFQSLLLKRIIAEGRADYLCCFTRSDAQVADMSFWECFKELFAHVAARADYQHSDGYAPSWRTQIPPNDGRWGYSWIQGQGLVPAQVTPHKLMWSDLWSSTDDIWHQAIFADVIQQHGGFADTKFVCRRDATVEGESLSGAFLCTGNVKLTCTDKRRGCLCGILICDGDVEVPHIFNSVVIASGRVICNDIRESVVVQGRSKALGIHFFELSDAGLEVVSNGGKDVSQGYPVTIRKPLEKQAFARSGFQPRDRLVSVNGKPLTSTEHLRRILRQHYVDNSFEPQALPIVVERGGKTMVVKLSYQ